MKRLLFLAALTTVICGVSFDGFGAAFENFGNKPLSESNYHHWKGIMPVIDHPSRVYHRWVNGSEDFYYRGDSSALNAALAGFAATEAPIRELILRPGPRKARTLGGKKEIAYDWSLHLEGGIARSRLLRQKDTSIEHEHPAMTVFVGGGNIELERVEVPKGLVVLQVADLRARYLKGLKSDDHDTRGVAARWLAAVDPYNEQNVPAIAKLLDDKDDRVRWAAAWALGRFGRQARSAIPALRKALENKNESESNKKRYREVIDAIENAKDNAEALRKQRAILAKISKFGESRHHDVEK